MTIIAGGDADHVQQDVAAVLERLPAGAAASVRLLLAATAGGDGDSYAQGLADALRLRDRRPGRPVDRDSRRPRAGTGRAGTATGPGAGGWRTFRPGPAAVEP